MDIELPWPPKELSPNARIHHMAKAKATREARESARWRAYPHMQETPLPDTGDIMVRMIFHPPDRRRRDLDGMFASCKAYLDGIADCFCVNDQRFAFHIMRAEPVKNGKVVVTIEPGGAPCMGRLQAA